MTRRRAEKNIGAWSLVTELLQASTVGSLDVNTPANPLVSESKFRQLMRARVSSKNAAGKH
jgi:hypothetical protein